MIDCGGGYLLPGLCDAHVHLEVLTDEGAYLNGVIKKSRAAKADWSQYIKVYLACGITQVRNMSGSPEILRLRGDIENGKKEGPHIKTLSPMIDGPHPLWEPSLETVTDAETVQAVWDAKSAGYDGIKVYNNLSVSQFDSALKAAREAGLTVSGHVPIAVGIDHCLDSDFYGYEHIKAIPRTHVEKAGQMHKTMTPTLVTQRSLWQYADAGIRRKMPAYGAKMHLSPAACEAWVQLAEQMSSHDFRLDRTYEEYRADVGRFLRAGGQVLAGTDAPFPYALPGYSLHDELEELVKGGLTPYEALAAATCQPARFLHTDAQRGTLEEGKEADMLLVRKNPLEDIRNTRIIQGVSFQGRWYDEAELARLLKDADSEGDQARS